MKLENKKIAILATDGFEESELTEPKKAIEEAGAAAIIVSPRKNTIRSWSKNDWGREFKVDQTLDEAKPEDFDGLLLPGGVLNPDQLRRNERAIEFVRSFFHEKNQRPVAAICHGPQLLINAKVVKDRQLTSYDSIRVDLENAGAKWLDREVVVDNGLVSSRSPEDMKAFTKKMVEEFAEGAHAFA